MVNLRVLIALCALMAWPKRGIWCMMSAYLAALTLLMSLAAGVGAWPDYPCHGGEITQPDGTIFMAYSAGPLPTGTISWWCSVELTRYNVNSSFYLKSKVPGDGYVIAVGGEPLINYGDGDPFLAFVHDEESSWYYYAERNEYGNYVFDAQDEYVASPYKVGIDDPPIYERPTDHIDPPPTAVQERSWGGVKTLFHK